MRVQTIEEKIYNIDDIKSNEDLKEKVLENYRYTNVDCDWYQFIVEEFKEKIKLLGYYNIEINFTGFHSQGDGASFVGKLEVNNDLLNRIGLDYLKESIKEIAINNIDVDIVRINSHYCHEKSIEVEVSTSDINHSRIDDDINSIARDIDKFISDEVYKLCLELYKELNDEYDYLTSDDAILEMLEDYEFSENGKIY